MNERKKLRAIMAGKRLVLMPGAYDALSARIIEAEGFQALVAGGYAGVGSMLAQADMGQSNMRDYADHYARICAAVELPVYVDADTGFGGVNNVRQMVRAFEAAGVAGLFISDQVFPNRCGYLPGKQIVPVEQMLAKVKAALDARRDPDLFIAARTDAAGVEGIESAIARCQLFMDAGADMAKPMGVDTIADIKRVLREVGGPHMATLSQAAGPEGAQPRGAGSGRRLFRDIPFGGAVRGGAGGAQRAAHAQAGQLARALPGAAHPARRLLRARRPEGAAGARGELRQRSRGARSQACGGIGEPRSMAPCKSIVTFCLAFGVSFGAHAQGAQEFYKNKQIRMIIGHPVGNDYDLAGRFLARYLGKHIPGEPTIIVQNMPAAASIAAANFLYAQAPRDGTVFGSFSRNVPSQALMGQMNVEADPRRFNWLGATSLPARVCVRWVTSPVKTPADLFTQEFIVGGAGAGSSLSILPTVFNHVLGTRFRIIQGYKGTTDTVLAMERGEVQGACASYGQFRIYEQLIRDGKLVFLLRAEETPIPEIPDVPSIFDYAKTAEQRQLMQFIFSSTEFGRPYVMPPDVPHDRVETMRKAFAETLQDPALLAEATRMKMDMTYRQPDRLEQLVASLYSTPPAMIETVKKLVPNLQ